MNQQNTTEKTLSDKVFDTIKTQKITPKPRWQFLLKDWVIWFFSVVCLIIGSLAFSVILYLIINSDWSIYKQIDDSFWDFVLLSMPYFWIIFLILFIFAANYNFKHTKKGYKYELHYVVIITILISMALGLFMFAFGAGRAIDNVLADRIPAYTKIIDRRVQLWSQPEKGLLAGEVIYVRGPRDFDLKAFDNKVYPVNAKGAEVIPNIDMKTGYKIRMIGSFEDKIFNAKKIIPLRPIRNPAMLKKLKNVPQR